MSIQYMRVKGVRRLPGVDIEEKLVGIVTLDGFLFYYQRNWTLWLN